MNHCKECQFYRAEVGEVSGRTWNFGKCSKLHTNANHALIWRHPSGYVPGDEVEVFSDFGCILWEPLTVMIDSQVSSHPISDG